MLNIITIMGHLCADPELRRTSNDIPFCTVRIAVARDYARDGEEREPDFFDVIAWRSTAEFLPRYFTKGRMIALTGHLQAQNWYDRDDNKRVSIEIIAESVYFADNKREDGHGAA